MEMFGMHVRASLYSAEFIQHYVKKLVDQDINFLLLRHEYKV